MHVEEMRRREPFASILAETLARTWQAEFGRYFHVREGNGAGQRWQERRPFSAFTSGQPSRRCRRFLRDSFRYTPIGWRRPAQWLLGTLAATPSGLRVGAGAAFSVEPAVAGAEDRLILPGNRRVRVFDFERGVVRVQTKAGFPTTGFVREIAVRGVGLSGPFPPITRQDAAAGWFEEPVLDAVALPRCPPGVDQPAIVSLALTDLDAWSAPTIQQEEAGARVEKLVAHFEELLEGIKARFGVLLKAPSREAVRVITECASAMGVVSTGVGHGDLQPGNILVGRDGTVVITDWEHSNRRFASYDRMVAGLGSRAPTGLARRIVHFVQAGGIEGLGTSSHKAAFRGSAAAMLVLEDLVWYAEECLGGPFRIPSAGFLQYVGELPAIAAAIGEPRGDF